MIQLYKDGNTNYTRNGDFSLFPIKAELTMELNGSWTLDIELSQDDELVDYLQHDTVIKADLPKYKGQLFVVTDPKRTGWDTVAATCYPIAMYDAQNELIVRDCRPTNMTGKNALNYILQASGGSKKYSVDCNITKLGTAYYIRKNFMECLASSDDNAFINRWGGEIIYDNYTFRVYEQAGQDRGFTIDAGKNVSGFQISEDDSDFCDVIIPVGYNGWTCPTEVRREKVSRVPHRKFVEYSSIKHINDASEDDKTDPSITVCDTDKAMQSALEKAARNSFAAGEFMPTFTYDIDFVDLRQYEAYQDYKELMYVWLGDRVQVRNLDRHIQTKQKVIGLTYDLVKDEITKLVLGTAAKDFFNATSQVVSDVQKVTAYKDGQKTLVAEKITGVIDALQTSMRAQRNVSQKQDVMAMLFEDIDPESPTFGAMSLGTQGLCISKTRLADNSGWDWSGSTAIDFNSIYANHIITGLLSGKDGNFWFDMDTGDFELGSGLFKGTINTSEDANIGNELYLDYDNDNQNARSGIYLGDSAQKGSTARIQMMSHLLSGSNPMNLIDLIATEGKAKIRIYDMGVDGASTVILTADGAIRLNSDSLTVQKSGKTYVGLTYSGIVNNITTVNGIVTGVS